MSTEAVVRPSAKQNWLRRALLLAGLAFLIWMISRYPLGDIVDACRGLGAWVLLCPLLCLCWFAASSAALHQLLGGKMPWRALFWNRLVGEGYNSILPAAGFGGEPFKLRHISRYVDTRQAVVALISDRLLDNTLAFAISGAAVGIGAFYYDVSAKLKTTMIIYAVIAAAVALVSLAVIFTSAVDRLSGRIAKWLGSDKLHDNRLPWPVLVRALGWFALARVFGMIEVALLFKLLGLPVTVGLVLFTTGAVAAAGFIGGAIPQGLGVTDGATVGIFTILHFAAPAGIAFALARRGRMLVVSAAGVLLHLAFGTRATTPAPEVATS